MGVSKSYGGQIRWTLDHKTAELETVAQNMALRRAGRPATRWEDSFLEMGSTNWHLAAKDKLLSKALVESLVL